MGRPSFKMDILLLAIVLLLSIHLSLSTLIRGGSVVVDRDLTSTMTESNDQYDHDDEPPLTASIDINGPSETSTQSLIAMQFSPDPHQGRNTLDLLKEGRVSIAGAFVSPKTSFDPSKDSYQNIQIEVCDVNTSCRQEDPSRCPRFIDMISESSHCELRRVVDLQEAIRAVKETDSSPSAKCHPMQQSPHGLIFHQGHSGLDLLSNILEVASPSTMTISEHPAIHEILTAPDELFNLFGEEHESFIDENKQVEALQDIAYLLGRTCAHHDHHRHHQVDKLYLGFHPGDATHISTVRKAFPESNWVVMTRNPCMSLWHMTGRSKGSSVCKKYGKYKIKALREYERKNGVDLANMSHEMVCAKYLESIVNATQTEYDSTGTGIVIDYDEDIIGQGIDLMLQEIFPYFGIREEDNIDEEAVWAQRKKLHHDHGWSMEQEMDDERYEEELISVPVLDAAKSLVRPKVIKRDPVG